MGNNWIACLLEEYGELYEALNAKALEVKIVTNNSIIHFDNVDIIDFINDKLYINNLEVITATPVRKVITLHLFDSLDNYSNELMLRETNNLMEYKNCMCVESIYTPGMCTNL